MIELHVSAKIVTKDDHTADEIQTRIRQRIETLCDSFGDSVNPFDDVRRVWADIVVTTEECD